MLLSVHSSFAVISMGKRELAALLSLSSRCLMIVVWLFLTMSRVCLQFVVVVIPDHTHLLFFLSYASTILSNQISIVLINRVRQFLPMC